MNKLLAYLITCVTLVYCLHTGIEYRKFLHDLGKFYYQLNKPAKSEPVNVVGQWQCSAVESDSNIIYDNNVISGNSVCSWRSCK
jgi:hypothetical protein